MVNQTLRLDKIITHCCDVKTFRFALDGAVPFKPGQYLVLSLSIEDKDVSKIFSISNSPTELGYIEFTKKLSESDFSKALKTLSVGQSYNVRFPMGKFTFEGELPKAVFLSGGIGITPIRSMLKYVTDKQLDSQVRLLYSSRSIEYLIFKNDLDQMQAANSHLKIIYTLTDCPVENESLYRRGRINAELIRKEIPDYQDYVFFVCGPPAMVAAMCVLLVKELNIIPDQIKKEDFLGY